MSRRMDSNQIRSHEELSSTCEPEAIMPIFRLDIIIIRFVLGYAKLAHPLQEKEQCLGGQQNVRLHLTLQDRNYPHHLCWLNLTLTKTIHWKPMQASLAWEQYYLNTGKIRSSIQLHMLADRYLMLKPTNLLLTWKLLLLCGQLHTSGIIFIATMSPSLQIMQL